MKKHFFLCGFLALALFSKAQNIGGSATYKTAGSIPFKMDDQNMPPDRKKMIEERMIKAMQKEFTLIFNRNESLYEEVVELEKEGQGGMRFMSMFTGGAGTYYKNIQEERFTDQTEFFGETFLIKDSLEHLEWKIEKETKSIGNYICQKATAMRIREVMKLKASREEGMKDSMAIDTVFITAWFSMQIPVSHGPGRYYGLPGLILEINDGNTVILCTKVSLNAKEEIAVNEPDKGDEVSEAEYTEITTKKVQEMQQIMGKGNQKGRGRGKFEITIGR
jgi:GLPGLI family protein